MPRRTISPGTDRAHRALTSHWEPPCERDRLPVRLHGRMPRNQRADLIGRLNELPAGCPRVLLAMGRLIGEGFDHPPLDTLVLAMPISWKGTLQPPPSRTADKNDIRIYDYLEEGNPALSRMWKKR
jgi:hypothetical protein